MRMQPPACRLEHTAACPDLVHSPGLINLRAAKSAVAAAVPTTAAAAACRGPRTERYSAPVAAPATRVLASSGTCRAARAVRVCLCVCVWGGALWWIREQGGWCSGPTQAATSVGAAAAGTQAAWPARRNRRAATPSQQACLPIGHVTREALKGGEQQTKHAQRVACKHGMYKGSGTT